MKKIISLRKDGSERVPYNLPEYRVYSMLAELSATRKLKVACHWHDDWEFISVIDGEVGYFVNGETFTLRAGQTIFVNSRCMHYDFSIDGSETTYICMLLHPSMFDQNPLIRERYIEPLIHNRAMIYRIYDRNSAMPIASALRAIRQSLDSNDPGKGLVLMQQGFLIIERLYRDMMAIPTAVSVSEPRLDALHSMIGYVQTHFAEGITLADIAAAGNVSKSSCCSIFRQYLSQTPVGYLTSYRLERSAELLRSTNLSVTEIAMNTGFASQSYFTETYRKHTGLTPTEYRRLQNET